MEFMTLLDKFKLWQFTLALSVILLALGFTGTVIVSDDEIIEGQETTAIILGALILLVSVGLRYIPPPERRNGTRNPFIAISATQTALSCSIVEWTEFGDASKFTTTDHTLNKDDLQIKNTSLRLELATMQGLLMRKVDDKGRHLLKYRYSDDATVFEPRLR